MNIAIKWLQNGSKVTSFAVETASRSNSLNKAFVKAFRSFEAAASLEYIRIIATAEDDKVSLQKEADGHLQFLQDHLSGLGKMAKSMTTEEKEDHRRFVTSSDIHDKYMKAPCLWRGFAKPRGYAGDAALMEMIYRNEFDGTDTFGKVVHKAVVGITACRAVRGRKDYLKEHIAACEGGRVLSMAAGPVREISEYLQENPSTQSQFLALDHDTDTLENYSIGDSRFQYAVANAFHFIRGDNTIAHPRKLPYWNHKHDSNTDFKGISALFAPLHYKLKPLPESHFDLVYTAGLFDYIMDFESPKKGCKALTRFLFDKVAPGGKLVIGNYNWSMPDLDYFLCDILCDWPLFYRQPEELCGFLDGIDSKHLANVTVEYESTGTTSFLVVTKK